MQIIVSVVIVDMEYREAVPESTDELTYFISREIGVPDIEAEAEIIAARLLIEQINECASIIGV